MPVSYEKAIQAFREALRIKPDDADTLNHLGQTYKAAGAYPEAIQAYREALRIKPGLAMTLTILALLTQRQDNTERRLRP